MARCCMLGITARIVPINPTTLSRRIRVLDVDPHRDRGPDFADDRPAHGDDRVQVGTITGHPAPDKPSAAEARSLVISVSTEMEDGHAPER